MLLYQTPWNQKLVEENGLLDNGLEENRDFSVSNLHLLGQDFYRTKGFL
jgi:hypothetical protein